MSRNGFDERSDEIVPINREPMKRQVGTIDFTPKWIDVLPIFLAAFESGTAAGRKMALAELRFMAMLADAGTLSEEDHATLVAKRAEMEAKTDAG